MPPVPPAVAAQQTPPLQQFAQGAAGQGQGQPQGQSTDQLLSQLLDQVGQTLTKIATIVGQTKPELIPILKQAVQALSMLASKTKSNQGGAPQGGSQGTQADNAPDASGGASMGMPQ